MAKPKSMATRKLISLPAGMAEAVNDYWHRRKLQSESEAIRDLLEIGLDRAGEDAIAVTPQRGLPSPAVDTTAPTTPPSSAAAASDDAVIAARLAEHPYPARTIASLSDEAIKDLGAKVPVRLRAQINWLAKVKGSHARVEIINMLESGFKREAERLGLKLSSTDLRAGTGQGPA